MPDKFAAPKELRMPVLYREAQLHFNEPVLSHDGLGRLVGYGEDDQDCYFLVKTKEGIAWHSCVGGMFWLNPLSAQGLVLSHEGEAWSDFTRIDNVLQLNGCEKEPEFILRLDHEKRSNA